MSAAIKNWYSCGLIEKLLLASENYRKEIKILPASRELPPSVHLARVPIYPRVYFPEIFCVHGCDSSRKIGNKALYRWSATWSNPIRVSFFFFVCCLRVWTLLFAYAFFSIGARVISFIRISHSDISKNAGELCLLSHTLAHVGGE